MLKPFNTTFNNKIALQRFFLFDFFFQFVVKNVFKLAQANVF